MAPHRHSIQRPRASTAAPLPSSVAWLDQFTFDVHASKTTEVRYELVVRHKALTSGWVINRSFDDFRDFQKHLLAAMDQGHFCRGSCHLMYSFMTSYFPKSTVFGSRSSRLMERRRLQLKECMEALQAFLLARENHDCSVVMNSMVKVFSSFVIGEFTPEHPLQQMAVLAKEGSRVSVDSFVSTSSSEEEPAIENFECGICNTDLSCDPSCPSENCASERSSVAHRHSNGFTTTLSCGHQFHDECLIPKLNEAMQCPTCGHSQL